MLRTIKGSKEIHLTVIDFNVSVDLVKSGGGVSGKTGVKKWQAPETKTQSHYTEVCDMWSVGVILYFMYSGGINPFYETEENSSLMNSDIEYSLLKL